MPKISSPVIWIQGHGGSEIWGLNSDKGLVTCRPCQKNFIWKKKSILEVHLRSTCHQKCLKIHEDSQILRESQGSGPLPFASDLAKMLAACNIPVNKVENRSFIQFIQKYTGLHLPSRATIIKNLESQGKAVLRKISDLTEGEDIYVFWDEAKDVRGKPVAAVFVGFLQKFLSRPLLIHLYEIKSLDADTIVEGVRLSLKSLWGSGTVKPERVKFFVTDNFPHTERAARVLREEFTEMQYFPCNTAGAQSIAAMVGEEPSKVSRIFIDTKRILKCDLNLPKHSSNMSMTYMRNLLLIQWNVDLIDF